MRKDRMMMHESGRGWQKTRVYCLICDERCSNDVGCKKHKERHPGVYCYLCCKPIGDQARWKCETCPSDVAEAIPNYCNKCFEKGILNHEDGTHVFSKINDSRAFFIEDYDGRI